MQSVSKYNQKNSTHWYKEVSALEYNRRKRREMPCTQNGAYARATPRLRPVSAVKGKTHTMRAASAYVHALAARSPQTPEGLVFPSMSTRAVLCSQ